MLADRILAVFTVVVGYWKPLNPAILTSVLIFVYFVIKCDSGCL
jgi:hypothetical protein